MTTKTVNNGLRDVTVITAGEGKHFVRKRDGLDFGNEIWLGIADKPENYDEVELEDEREAENAEVDLA